MNKVLILGAGGQLGQEFQAIAGSATSYDFTFVTRAEVDIVHLKELQDVIEKGAYDTLINCAAYTAVDKAEEEAEKADLINAVAVRNIAALCAEYHIALIHISTDYVFDGKGTTPYQTTDATAPLGVYGKTKRRGEEAILQLHPDNSIIVRTAWLYSSFGHNFVKTMLRLGATRDKISVVNDQIGAPTYARDLATAVLKMIPQVGKHNGVYHYVNEGSVSWYAFAKAILAIAHPSCTVHPVPSSAYPTKVERPKYSVLDTSHTKSDFALTIRPWREALEEALTRMT